VEQLTPRSAGLAVASVRPINRRPRERRSLLAADLFSISAACVSVRPIRAPTERPSIRRSAHRRITAEKRCLPLNVFCLVPVYLAATTDRSVCIFVFDLRLRLWTRREMISVWFGNSLDHVSNSHKLLLERQKTKVNVTSEIFLFVGF
jgi:hypothetical protein